MKRALMVLVIAMLAGCSDKETSEPEAPVVPAPPTDADHGGVQGIVVDAAVFPIPDATVTVIATGVTTQTDANGAFAIGDLLPGTHFLLIDKVGYAAIQAHVDVVAGEVSPLLRVQLQADASELPFVEHIPYSVYMACSVSSPGGRSNTCQYVQARTGVALDETPNQRVETDGYPDYVLGELLWEGTSLLGNGLTFIMSDGTDFSPFETEGESPLHLGIDRAGLENGTGGWNEGSSAMVEPGKEFMWSWGAAGSGLTNPPVCPADLGIEDFKCWGVGVTLQQRAELFTSVFYRVVPPEDYRYADHGNYLS